MTPGQARRLVQRSVERIEAETALRSIFLGGLLVVVLGVLVAAVMASAVIFASTETEGTP